MEKGDQIFGFLFSKEISLGYHMTVLKKYLVI